MTGSRDRDLVDALRRFGADHVVDPDELWLRVEAALFRVGARRRDLHRRTAAGPGTLGPLSAAVATTVVVAVLFTGRSSDAPARVERAGPAAAHVATARTSGADARASAVVAPAATHVPLAPARSPTGAAAATDERPPLPGTPLLLGDPSGPGTVGTTAGQAWTVFTGTGWEHAGSGRPDDVTVVPPAGATADAAPYAVRWTDGVTTPSGTVARWLVGAETQPWTVRVTDSARRRTVRVHGGGVGPGVEVSVTAPDGRSGAASWDAGPSGAFVVVVELPPGPGPWTVVLSPTDGSRVAVSTVTVTAD